MAEFDSNSGMNLGVVQDIQNLDRLRQMSQSESKEGKAEALQAASRQFESIFTQMLFKGMRQANQVLTQDNPMSSSYTQFYEGMLDEQRVADMSSKGGLGLANMVAKQLSPETFTHNDGRILKMPQRTERVYKPYQPPTAAANDLIEASKVGKDFAEKEMAQEKHDLAAPRRTHRTVPPMGPRHSAGATAQDGSQGFDTPQEFVNRLMPLAKKAADKLGLSPAVLVAQAALESGWGKRVIRDGEGQITHNLFGIKADPRWQGPKTVVSTLEYEQGVASRQKAAFRSYESFEESFNDYVDFLTSGTRYKGALAKVDSPDRYFEALQQAGYATDPHYARKLKQVLRSDAIAQYNEREL
ncbi:flagellar assembly peptidoglycan hydrolase FlgJ [Aeromonas enteropelogenes]|uniref:flagellar assembly peptidoglycan hydrolase FlgJ n=1 Tax=Aeromonas enteropelogenes TaxID=29489 RepID=UPI0005AA9C1D|nr:flagellar assembly peptidoglycan hydrolase FlgJ [Aeromonas enteropelogenes]MBL0520028.1 flagellar assembly peptidoglycan hydrolase FlgJ [Aeromonas enteropelogenes]UBH51065.1 flagellar assembly peptidoglycan hydrolase FlgJ [Aeromonas enteropelogenes]